MTRYDPAKAHLKHHCEHYKNKRPRFCAAKSSEFRNFKAIRKVDSPERRPKNWTRFWLCGTSCVREWGKNHQFMGKWPRKPMFDSLCGHFSHVSGIFPSHSSTPDMDLYQVTRIAHSVWSRNDEIPVLGSRLYTRLGISIHMIWLRHGKGVVHRLVGTKS